MDLRTFCGPMPAASPRNMLESSNAKNACKRTARIRRSSRPIETSVRAMRYGPSAGMSPHCTPQLPHPEPRLGLRKGSNSIDGAQLLHAERSDSVREPGSLGVRGAAAQRGQKAAGEAIASAGCVHDVHFKTGELRRAVRRENS